MRQRGRERRSFLFARERKVAPAAPREACRLEAGQSVRFSVRMLDDKPSFMLKIAGSEETFKTLDGLTAQLRSSDAGGETYAKAD